MRRPQSYLGWRRKQPQGGTEGPVREAEKGTYSGIRWEKRTKIPEAQQKEWKHATLGVRRLGEGLSRICHRPGRREMLRTQKEGP